MLRFVILFALVVCALTHPMLRETRDTGDADVKADAVPADGEGTNLEGRFGGGGYGGYPGGDFCIFIRYFRE